MTLLPSYSTEHLLSQAILLPYTLDHHRLEKWVTYDNFPFLISLTMVSILKHFGIIYKYGG